MFENFKSAISNCSMNVTSRYQISEWNKQLNKVQVPNHDAVNERRVAITEAEGIRTFRIPVLNCCQRDQQLEKVEHFTINSLTSKKNKLKIKSIGAFK